MLSNVQGFGPGQLVDGERTEHGEVVAGEGADELVVTGGRRGERRLTTLARSKQDRGAQQPGVARRQPVVVLTSSQAGGGHVILAPSLDQRPVMGVDAGGVVEGHHHLGACGGGQRVGIKL